MPNHEIWVPRGMTSLRQAVGNDMKKYSLHLIFTFDLNSHIGAGNIPFCCIQLKTAFQSVCVAHWLAIETVSKIVGSR